MLLVLSLLSYGQVTIGSGSEPAKAALLELKTQDANNPGSVTATQNVTSTKGGFGLPRVKLENKATLQPFIPVDAAWNNNTGKVKEIHAGLTVYNLNTANGFKQGVYTWDGAKWYFLGEDAGQQFFYMPSFNLPLASHNPDGSGNNQFNLFDEYKKQFTKDASNPRFTSSDNTMTQIPGIYDASRLTFIVTWYDNTVITVNSISTAGVLNYKPLKASASADSYMNIIFVVKD
jgi:hypothetical protein